MRHLTCSRRLKTTDVEHAAALGIARAVGHLPSVGKSRWCWKERTGKSSRIAVVMSPGAGGHQGVTFRPGTRMSIP